MGERILENEKETIHESGLIHFKRKENSYHLVRIKNPMFGPHAMQSINTYSSKTKLPLEHF